MQTPWQWWRSSGWSGRMVAILAVLYVLYVLVVFLVLPGWLRDQSRERLAEWLGRDVTLEKVALNPFTLSVTAEGFAVADPNTDTLARFDRLYVNAGMWASLFHWRPWIGELHLEGLRVRLRREADGSLNIDDLIARLQQDAEADAVRAEPGAAGQMEDSDSDSGPPAFTLKHLNIDNGAVDLIDATGEQPLTLTLPVAFVVDDLTTRGVDENDNRYQLHVEGPDGGTLDWDGRVLFEPLTVNGRLRMDKVDLVSFAQLLEPHFRFSVPAGVLALSANYRFGGAPGEGLALSDGNLTLSDLRIRPQAGDQDSLTVAEMVITGVALDTAERRLTIPEARMNDPSVRAVLSGQGLDLATLFLPLAQPSTDQAEQIVSESDAKQKAWRVHLERFAVTNAAAVFRDRTLAQPRELTFTEGGLTISDLRLDQEGVRWQWEGDGKLLEKGALTHSGQGRLAPLDLQAALKLDGLPLAAFSPWLEAALPMALEQGNAGADLKLVLSGAAPNVMVSGRASVEQGVVSEHGRRFLSVSNLSADGLRVDSDAGLVAIDGLAARGLDFLHLIDEQGRGLGVRLLGDDEDDHARSADDGGWRVRLGRVSVQESRIAHRDLTLSPQYQVTVEDWHGHMDGFDSGGGEARVDIQGSVNGTAALTLAGTVDAEPLTLDLAGTLNGYGMETLTPFTARYLGFAVQRGHLGLDSKVTLRDNRLDASTKVAADHFYLGDRVASDQAISAPVKLGLSVLRDGSGMIRLPVTLSGDISDPDFSVSGLVLRVITNILVKAATAPFSMLAGLVGGGEELEYVPFAAGGDEPDAATRRALSSLAEILRQREAITVVLTGQTNHDDRRILAEQAVVDEVGGDWPGLDSALTSEQWRQRIFDAYEDALDADPTGLPGDDGERGREAWQRLLERAAAGIETGTLVELAERRAEQARRVLMREHELPERRITLKAPEPDGEHAGVALGAEGL